jgi:hypothetical protein
MLALSFLLSLSLHFLGHVFAIQAFIKFQFLSGWGRQHEVHSVQVSNHVGARSCFCCWLSVLVLESLCEGALVQWRWRWMTWSSQSVRVPSSQCFVAMGQWLLHGCTGVKGSLQYHTRVKAPRPFPWWLHSLVTFIGCFNKSVCHETSSCCWLSFSDHMGLSFVQCEVSLSVHPAGIYMQPCFCA